MSDRGPDGVPAIGDLYSPCVKRSVQPRYKTISTVSFSPKSRNPVIRCDGRFRLPNSFGVEARTR